MATQRYFADDGSEHDSLSAANEHDEIAKRLKPWLDECERLGERLKPAQLKAVRAFVAFERGKVVGVQAA